MDEDIKTCHERHIRSQDVQDLAELLRQYPNAEYNIEGNPHHNLMASLLLPILSPPGLGIYPFP